MPEPTREATIRFREESLPPYDPSHGTPNRTVRRTLEFDLPGGTSRWEQTDYGHPGRFNPWDHREVATPLQPKSEELRAVAEALTALLGDG